MADDKLYQRTYSVLVENEPGVLARIAGLFSARGYNIISLTVGETQDVSMSRMTIVAEGTTAVLEQINKQLNKIIPVISVLPISDSEIISEEHILVKVSNHEGLEAFVQSQRDQGESVRILHAGDETSIIRVVANRNQERALFKEMQQFEIIELCRAGQVAISKDRTFGYLQRQGE